MRKADDSNGLIEASYDGVKLELKETESSIRKLQERAEKLRVAVAALQDLVSEPQTEPINGVANADVWMKHDAPM